jgi:xylulokinase
MYALVHDVGTTANKSCIYKLGEKVELVASEMAEYPLYVLPNGGVEQDVEDWWRAICDATRRVIRKSNLSPNDIGAMTFCAQMQAFIPVDKDGNALRFAMNYLDIRSMQQLERYLFHGLLRIEKWNAFKVLRWIQVNGGAALTAKDPLWKYHWVKENEPEVFDAMHVWLDAKDYLAQRSTGRFVMGYDSAHLTFLYDTRPDKLGWHEGLCKTYDVDMDHLPPVIKATDVVGHLLPKAAEELGLLEGIPVFGGGGDLPLITVGAGCLETNDMHIYIGTSGWVASTVDKRMTDVFGMAASIMGAIPGAYSYISEQETSGRCLQWVRDHLALDAIGVYLDAKNIEDKEEEQKTLYQYLNEVVEKVRPGAGGVIFTPWLHGNRSPIEDPYARGMFFNIGLETGKRHLVRSVLEGVAFNKRWCLETIERKVPRQDVLRFVGGGAQSEVWAQIIADVTNRRIEIVENAQSAGTIGGAIVCAVGLGIVNEFRDAKKMITVANSFDPQPENQEVYDKHYKVFKDLYMQNRKLFREMNA